MYNFEQIGFIPRSIIRTLKRFLKQISLKTDLFVIYEFRVSRYIAIASLQCFFFLIICPWIFQFFVKFLFLNTFLKYKIISTDIFMNFHQQERAFSQIQTFSQKIYFETLLESFEMIHKNQRNIPRTGLADRGTLGSPPGLGPARLGQPLALNRRVLKQGVAEGQMYKYVCPSREVASSQGARPQILTQLDFQRSPQLASPPSFAGPNCISRNAPPFLNGRVAFREGQKEGPLCRARAKGGGCPSAPGGLRSRSRGLPNSLKEEEDWLRAKQRRIGLAKQAGKPISAQTASPPFEKLTKPNFGLLHRSKHCFGLNKRRSRHSCFLSRLGKMPSRSINQKALQSLKYTDGQRAFKHGENKLIDGQRITEKDHRQKLARFPLKADLSVSLAARSGTGNNLLSSTAFSPALTPSGFGTPRRPSVHPIALRAQKSPGASTLSQLSLSYLDWANPGVLQGPMTTRPSAQIYQIYFLKCANFYNKQSVTIITNWILDLVTLLFFLVLLILLTPQILILKTFCIESLLSLSETTKCFFLIFFLDLLVGFHSSKSWEIFLQFLIEHFGFHIHQNFIAFFISTFPVLLDTIFKYWIFRYLNKISPSTVATYQAMIE